MISYRTIRGLRVADLDIDTRVIELRSIYGDHDINCGDKCDCKKKEKENKES